VDVHSANAESIDRLRYFSLVVVLVLQQQVSVSNLINQRHSLSEPTSQVLQRLVNTICSYMHIQSKTNSSWPAMKHSPSYCTDTWCNKCFVSSEHVRCTLGGQHTEQQSCRRLTIANLRKILQKTSNVGIKYLGTYWNDTLRNSREPLVMTKSSASSLSLIYIQTNRTNKLQAVTDQK